MPMPNELDPRIIRVSFEVNGRIKTYSSPFYIQCTGTKYANSLQNECNVVIANLDKQTQDYILTETTPYNTNNTIKSITVEAGRQSYGTSVIYTGNIVYSNLSQPPDVGITLKCLTGNFLKTKVIGVNQSGQASIQQISLSVSNLLGLVLRYEATNKTISNYNFSGSGLNQIAELNAIGGINAYQDDGVLVVKDAGVPLKDTLKIINSSTGMIGIPEFTEQGLKVKFLLDNHVVIGGRIRVISSTNSAANGEYLIYKLSFEIATRDTPFYYIAEAQRIRN
jgi:hypothetical protein